MREHGRYDNDFIMGNVTNNLAAKPIDEPEDKAIVRLAITYGVLRRLGFSEGRAEECLRAINGVDMDDAFEWVRLRNRIRGLFPETRFSFISIATRMNLGPVKVSVMVVNAYTSAYSLECRSRRAKDANDSEDSSYRSSDASEVRHRVAFHQVSPSQPKSRPQVGVRCKCTRIYSRADDARDISYSVGDLG